MVLMILAMQGGSARSPGLRECFPGVRADVAAKIVEFDGQITPMLVKDDRAPMFFLEVLACAPNTREHETFIVTTARPSHIHAALLLIGLAPGSPGSWKATDGTLEPIQPTGDRLSVRVAWTDKEGHDLEQDPLDWLVGTRLKSSFWDAERAVATASKLAAPGWVFAGSKFVKRRPIEGGDEREVYDADGSGTVVGFTTFGSEVIAWSRVISHDWSSDERQWIADFAKTPPAETKVRVRVGKAE